VSCAKKASPVFDGTCIGAALVTKLCAEQERIAKDEQRKAKILAENDIKEKTSEIDLLREHIKNNDEKLAEARQKQADFMKKERELEDKARELD